MSSQYLRDGQAFGRYEIVRMIGQGGMGAVYEAFHKGLKKKVAIKTLLPSIAQLPEANARFLREGEAASRIRHPHVVDVTDVGTQNVVPDTIVSLTFNKAFDAHLALLRMRIKDEMARKNQAAEEEEAPDQG